MGKQFMDKHKMHNSWPKDSIYRFLLDVKTLILDLLSIPPKSETKHMDGSTEIPD